MRPQETMRSQDHMTTQDPMRTYEDSEFFDDPGKTQELINELKFLDFHII